MFVLKGHFFKAKVFCTTHLEFSKKYQCFYRTMINQLSWSNIPKGILESKEQVICSTNDNQLQPIKWAKLDSYVRKPQQPSLKRRAFFPLQAWQQLAVIADISFPVYSAAKEHSYLSWNEREMSIEVGRYQVMTIFRTLTSDSS